jgi:hypothetical protein
MRTLLTPFCIVSIVSAVNCSSIALADSQLTRGQQQAASATTAHASLKSYNCIVASLHDGKCEMDFVIEGNKTPVAFSASPEVAAIFDTDSKFAKAPWDDVVISYMKNMEVIKIVDGNGVTISKKIDFSR